MISWWGSVHNSCDIEELRANFEPRLPSRVGIHLHAHPALADGEAQCPASARETFRFAHDQDGPALNCREDLWQPALFGSVHEHHLAGAQPRGVTRTEVTHFQQAVADALTFQNAIESTELIAPNDADDKMRVRAVVGGGRPFHELGEFEKICGLHVVLGLGVSEWREQTRQRDDRAEDGVDPPKSGW